MKNELSESNVKLISQYDMEIVIQSIAIATRQKHLRTLLGLTRILRKDWKKVTIHSIEGITHIEYIAFDPVHICHCCDHYFQP